MSTPPIDWKSLNNIRNLYVGVDQALQRDYWRSEALLRDYDATFGRRILWKWQAALGNAKGRGLDLRGTEAVVDWGCGSGVAAEALTAELGPTWAGKLILVDRSSRATAYVARKLAALWPQAQITMHNTLPTPLPAASTLLVSHVLTELDDPTLRQLLAAARTAQSVLWVEPGTPYASRRLGQARDELRAVLTPIAPCLHAGLCGMFDPARTADWCHHFAPAPAEVHRMEFWRNFAKETGVDLRSLPFSYLAMQAGLPTSDRSGQVMIGRARIYKGYAKVLTCAAKGVKEGRIQERRDKAFFKALADAPSDLVLDDDRVDVIAKPE